MGNTLFNSGDYIIDKNETLKQRYDTEYARLQDRFLRVNQDAEDTFSADSLNPVVDRSQAGEIYRRGLEAQKALLSYQNTHDSLTGALSRVGLRENLINIAQHTINERIIGENQAEKSLLMFFIDADDFKALNDTHGHDIGDQGLINLAQEIYAHIRHNTSAEEPSNDSPEDIIARLGGDEFVVIVITDTTKVTEVLQLLQERLNVIKFTANGTMYEFGARVGHAAIPLTEVRSMEQLQELMKEADSSMYEEKDIRKAVKLQQVASSAAEIIFEATREPNPETSVDNPS